MGLDKRIDQLATTTPANADQLAIWDASLSSTRKLTIAQIAAFIGSTAGAAQKLYFNNATGFTLNDPILIGVNILLIFRGGIAGDEIITTGIPGPDQILHDTATGDLTFGSELLDERVTVIYA